MIGKLRAKRANACGFTIVELMMATAVFSVVLLLVTMGVIQVNRVYYKGVTEANTQTVARNIIDAVSQAIQFNGGTITPSSTPVAPVAGSLQYICIGNQQFIYRPGFQLVSGVAGAGQVTQSLIQRTIVGSCSPPTVPYTGRELLTPNMRLSYFNVAQVGSATSPLYSIGVRVSYGDSTVLNNPTSTVNSPQSAATSCKGIQAGNQFCALSDLSTTVEKRVK